ncbi:MAG: ATP-binding protein [Desulfobulbaceae bacterium]|nr:ATP-binding protein [Desulfobulbaceae bacterium]
MAEQKKGRSLQLILDAIPTPLLMIEADYSVSARNMAAQKFSTDNPATPGDTACCSTLADANGTCPLDGGDCLAKEVLTKKTESSTVKKITDGNEVDNYFEVCAIPVLDEQGNISRIIESWRDVTSIYQNKKLKLAYQEQNAIFQEHETLLAKVITAKKEWEQAMDCLTDMVILVDSQGSIMRCNVAFSSFMGRYFASLVGQNYGTIFTECGLSGPKSHISDTSESEMFHPSSGKTFLQRNFPVTLDGDITGMVITLQDVSVRKQALAQLDNHRRRLQQTLDQLSAMITQVMNDKRLEKTFALMPLDMEPCWQVFDCEQKECPCYGKEAMRCWQASHTACNENADNKTDKCQKCAYYEQAQADPIFSIGEQFNKMMDILENKNQELEKAYAELKASQSQLLQQEKMASIGQLAAGVAHEINNPIGFVTSNLGTLAKYLSRFSNFLEEQTRILTAVGEAPGIEALQAKRADLKLDFLLEDAVGLINESLDGVGRVKKIVQNLKTFSRIDQTDFTLADINQCLEDTLNIIWNELKYKTTVHKEYGILPLTKCYPQQLNQVFLNLLVNAAQAIPEKGDIFIKTWCTDNEVMVSISDTGSGIDPKNINHLFEPFFTTKAVGEGTGLGLSIVYEIITMKHNGCISVDSTPGKGTTFTVQLPLILEP